MDVAEDLGSGHQGFLFSLRCRVSMRLCGFLLNELALVLVSVIDYSSFIDGFGTFRFEDDLPQFFFCESYCETRSSDKTASGWEGVFFL